MSFIYGWQAIDGDGNQHFFIGSLPLGSYVNVMAYSDESSFEAAMQTLQMPILTIEKVRSNKQLELSGACRSQITNGFQSSALGTPHTYPSNQTDQQNLNASVTASLLPNLSSDWTTPFWCCDNLGNWSYEDHTVEQIQQVGLDAKTSITALQFKLFGFSQQVASATTVDEIVSISWTSTP